MSILSRTFLLSSLIIGLPQKIPVHPFYPSFLFQTFVFPITIFGNWNFHTACAAILSSKLEKSVKNTEILALVAMAGTMAHRIAAKEHLTCVMLYSTKKVILDGCIDPIGNCDAPSMHMHSINGPYNTDMNTTGETVMEAQGTSADALGGMSAYWISKLYLMIRRQIIWASWCIFIWKRTISSRIPTRESKHFLWVPNKRNH